MEASWRKWIGFAAGGLFGLVVLTGSAFYSLSQLRINKTYHRLATVTHVVATPELLARGEHLAVTRGCAGCHEPDLRGQMFWEEKGVGRQYAANLTLKAQSYSDADLDRAIRGGIDKHGHPLWDMPSAMYADLTDADTAAIIAYIRSKPAGGKAHPDKYFAEGWRWEIIRDAEPHSSARHVDDRKVPPDLGPELAAGRYIAMTACTECHGGTLEGLHGGHMKTPDLAIVAGYSDAEFVRLMRTGVPTGGRKLELMSEVAKSRFSHFSDEEISGLYAYLKARGLKQASQSFRPNSLTIQSYRSGCLACTLARVYGGRAALPHKTTLAFMAKNSPTLLST
jgi:cytochrome c553